VATKTCSVSFTGPSGVRHSGEVSAESLFEAAIVGFSLLKQDGWVEPVAPGTQLEIQVKHPATTHLVSLAQLRRWVNASAISPNDTLKKRKLKSVLADGEDLADIVSDEGRAVLYFSLACTFLRSAQYRFIRWETALRAAADMRRVRFLAVWTDWRTARRPSESASSGKVRSIAMISARSCLSAASAPVRASSRSLSVLRPLLEGLAIFVISFDCGNLASHRLAQSRHYRRSKSLTMRAGSIASARATSMNSITSSRRSPRSNFETND
jgi:hypothetical protein